MTVIAPDTWERLRDQIPQGDHLNARFACPEISERLIGGLDAAGRRHLLIPLEAEDKSYEDRQSRGVGVQTRHLSVTDRPPGRFVDIICLDESGHGIFDLIGGDLADRLAQGVESPEEIVSRVLAKFRRFWGQTPRQLLTRQEQIGLFAELWFLSAWLAPAAGPDNAIEQWRGPTGTRHDFEWPGCSVEVKGTTSVRELIHRVHGLDQLSPPEKGDLLFFSLKLRDEAGAVNTLPGLVSACRKLAAGYARAPNLLDQALLEAGYLPEHEDEYNKSRFRIVEEGLYRVDGGFPKITLDSFGGRRPVGVEYIEYDINLGDHRDLLIAERPRDFEVVWRPSHRDDPLFRH